MKGDITIVGGGWSVLNVAIDCLCGMVVAVNDSAVHLPRYDVAVSMDRLWTEHRWDFLTRQQRQAWLRRSAVQNIETEGADYWLTIFECDHRDNAPPTMQPGHLNGTSSGMCAVNYALQMRPSRVFLLGFDMTRDPFGRAHWYAPYSWVLNAKGATSSGTYRTWARQFDELAKAFRREKIEVRNVSPSSAIEAFPKMSPADYMKECK